MTDTGQAREFISRHGEYLTCAGDQLDGWTVVSREYVRFKYGRVFFTIVAADPDGQLWQYGISESTVDGPDVEGDPTPVSAVVETKKVVTFAPRLIRRREESA